MFSLFVADSICANLPISYSPPETGTPVRPQPIDRLRQGSLLPVVEMPRVVMDGVLVAGGGDASGGDGRCF
ncbi:hypothetical protein Dimus_030455 [Dionaea muscipula]